MMKELKLVLALVVAAGLSGSALANPGTTGALNGVEDVYTGAIPPPGFYLLNYGLYYHGNVKNANGGTNLTAGTPLVTHGRVTLIADAVRVLYSSNIQVLGGNLAWHTVVPLVHKDVTVGGMTLYPQSGLGDVYLSPAIIGWHLRDGLHIAAGLDVILPTGEFSRRYLLRDPVDPRIRSNMNIGTNHYTFEPVFAVSKEFENGVILDAKLMYDLHTEEPVTNITTGQQFHMDYAITAPLIINIEGKGGVRLGLNGYYFAAMEQDEYRGSDINGSKERVFAFGPLARYDVSPTTSLTFKALFEQNAHNRPEGNAFWLKLVHAF